MAGKEPEITPHRHPGESRDPFEWTPPGGAARADGLLWAPTFVGVTEYLPRRGAVEPSSHLRDLPRKALNPVNFRLYRRNKDERYFDVLW